MSEYDRDLGPSFTDQLHFEEEFSHEVQAGKIDFPKLSCALEDMEVFVTREGKDILVKVKDVLPTDKIVGQIK